MGKLNRTETLKFIEGHRRAEAWQEQERMTRLARLSLAEARAIYHELNTGWETLPQPEDGLERLELWRIETLAKVRQTFEQLARLKGWL